MTTTTTTTTTSQERAPRNYSIEMRDDCVAHTVTVTIPAGTEAEQDAAAAEEAREAAEEWGLGGNWGPEGGAVVVSYVVSDDDYEWPEESMSIALPIDHDALMRAAGADPQCRHAWTAEGEGGCKENPGVWSHGGTAISARVHCRHCGLARTLYFSEPSEPADSVRYEMPSARAAADE